MIASTNEEKRVQRTNIWMKGTDSVVYARLLKIRDPEKSAPIGTIYSHRTEHERFEKEKEGEASKFDIRSNTTSAT